MLISTSTSVFTDRYGEEEAIRLYAQAGFDGLDFGLFHLPVDGEVFRDLDSPAFEAYFTRLRRIAQENHIAIFQVHAPFPLKVCDPERDPILLTCAVKSIYATQYMGSEYVVIHPIMPRGCIYGRENAYARDINFTFYQTLIPHLLKTGVKIAIENMFSVDPDTHKLCPTICSSADDMIDYIDGLNQLAGDTCFVACLDIGHAAISGTPSVDMLHRLGSRVKVLHAHDNDGLCDAHTAPGLGKFDWKAIASAVREIGFDGMFNFEADSFYALWQPDVYGREVDLQAAKLLCTIGHAIMDHAE